MSDPLRGWKLLGGKIIQYHYFDGVGYYKKLGITA